MSSSSLQTWNTSNALLEARINKHCNNLTVGGVSKPDMKEMFQLMTKRLGYTVCLKRPDWEEGMKLYAQFKKHLLTLEIISRDESARGCKNDEVYDFEYGSTLNDAYADVGIDLTVASDKFYSWMDKFAKHLEGKDVRIGPGMVIDGYTNTTGTINSSKINTNAKIEQLLGDIVKQEVFPKVPQTNNQAVRLHQFSLSYHVDHERLITLFSPPNCTLPQEQKHSGDDSTFVLEIFTNADERIRQMRGCLHDVATTFVEMMPMDALVTRSLQYQLPFDDSDSHPDSFEADHSDGDDHVDEDEDVASSSNSGSGSDEDEPTMTAPSSNGTSSSRRRKVEVVGKFVQVTESIL